MTGFPLTCAQLQARFPTLITEILGDATIQIDSVDAPDSAKSSSLVFVIRDDALTTSLASPAAVLIVSGKTKTQLDLHKTQPKQTILVSPSPELALARITNDLILATPYRDLTSSSSQSRIHPTAIIDPNASIHSTARVGPYAVIQSHVKIGADSSIGSHCVIEAGAEIGSNTTLHPFVYVGHHCQIQDRCEVHAHSVIGKEGYGYAHDSSGNHFRIPHRGRVVLESDVHVGAHCAFDRGTFGETRIGKMTKIDNHVHVAHNCQVGANSLLTAGFMMAGSSSVGKFFVAGGRANITGHVHICDHVQISGLSGVTKSITEAGQYGGFPLQSLQDSIKTRSALVHLHEMRKQLKELLKSLRASTESSD